MKQVFIFLIILVNIYGIQSQTWKRYNLQTGQITEIPFSYTSNGSSDLIPGNKGILPENISNDTIRKFFPNDIVNEANSYPWRITVKFNDVTGVLIDPYHVLTAGHAIEFHPYFQTVPFIPGYENGDFPFQYAYAEYFYQLSDFASGTPKDIAIVKLDRPIGVISGWNGYGYNNDNNFFLNHTFFNPSYPSQSPFNGEYLYNWKGLIDNIGTEYLISSRAGYGGMSGSPLYTAQNNYNVVYGVLTNLGIKYNRLTANKFDAINAVINSNTPTQFDMIPMYTNISPKIIKTGNHLESLSYILHNYSTENKSNANITVNVYLSTDKNITATDELIATYNYTKSFSAKSSELIEQTASLPIINKAEGNYWIGITVSGDNNTTNNTTKTLDVAPITVVNNNMVTIKGRITSSQTNSGISNVTMQGFTYVTKTDNYGYYETQVQYGWSGTITPTKAGYNFSNSSTSYSNIIQTTTTNYSAVKKTYSISGFTKSPVTQAPISNVKLTGLINEPLSGTNGYFSVTVFYGWSGNVFPVKGNLYNFEPYRYSFSNTTSDNSVLFSGGFYISGRCAENSGMPISGVEMQGFPFNVITDENGEYSAFIDSGWTGSVTPVKNDIVFFPSERNYENIINSVDLQDYFEQKAAVINLKLFLAGAMYENSDTMSTVLNYKNYLPLVPPDTLSGSSGNFVYFREPNEIVSQKFFQYHRDIVDWIIIELRDDKNFEIPVDTIPAFLRRDGKVLSISGDSVITLGMNITPANYYIIIRHRNHLSIMTSNPVYLSSDSYLYDFSDCLESYYGFDAAQMSNGKFGMYPGDADKNGLVNIEDYQLYQNNCITASSGYLYTDFNLDGYLTGTDFNIFAPVNKKRITTNVPNSSLIKFYKTRK